MSDVRSTPYTATRSQRMPPLNGNKIAAIVVWIIGVGSTWLGIKVFLDNPPWYVPFIAALIAQFVLTWGEKAIWRGRASIAGIAALVIDIGLNAGGIYPYALRLGETPTAQMIVSVFGGGRQNAPRSDMIAAVILGFIIAALPEELWMRRD